MLNRFKYTILMMISWVPSLFGQRANLKHAIFGVYKEADDLVLDTLRDSGTYWIGSNNWKDKIKESGAKAYTVAKQYHFDGIWRGCCDFDMQRQGQNLLIKTKIQSDEMELPATASDGLKIRLNEAEAVIYNGRFNMTQADQYTKCVHTVYVGEEPATKTQKILDILLNRPTCSNPSCHDQRCKDLRENAAWHDLATTIATALENKNLKIRRVSKCESLFPMDRLSEVLEK